LRFGLSDFEIIPFRLKPFVPFPKMKELNDVEDSLIIKDLRRYLFASPDDAPAPSQQADNSNQDPSSVSASPAVALPVAAIRSLLCVIQRTKAETMMGLQKELKLASDAMLEFANSPSNTLILGGRSHIALASGCELFMKYITRCFLELPDFKECMSQIISRGQRFSDISLAARDRIAVVGKAFIREGATVLTHGMSSVVSNLLKRRISMSLF
jgi:translation initiation factor 2B subunit (eIF-2B alpha/beta/delta family)